MIQERPQTLKEQFKTYMKRIEDNQETHLSQPTLQSIKN
jgi:hypothetical protein